MVGECSSSVTDSSLARYASNEILNKVVFFRRIRPIDRIKSKLS